MSRAQRLGLFLVSGLLTLGLVQGKALPVQAAAVKVKKIKRVSPEQKETTVWKGEKITFQVRLTPRKLSKKAAKITVKIAKTAVAAKSGKITYKKKNGYRYAAFSVKAKKAGKTKLTIRAAGGKKLVYTVRVKNRPETADVVDVSDVTEAQNARAADMMLDFWQKDKTKNVMVSGHSLGMALSLLTSGAQGETLAELEKYLGSDKSGIEAHAKSASAACKELEIDSANGVWADKMISLKKSYIQTMDQTYHADVRTIDFSANDAADEINQWCSEKTHKMIPSLVTQDQVRGQRLMLVNALYFDQNWTEPFQGKTQEQDFYTASGEKIRADMMNGEGDGYIETTDSVGVVKRYQNGCCFVAIRDKEGKDVKPEDIRNLASLCKKADTQPEVILYMPKVKFTGSYPLTDYLRQKGIRRAFLEEAQLGGITDTPLMVSEVLQKTAVEINETGTKASAATGILAEATCFLGEKKTYRVVLDHPYAFGIYHANTGEMLFTGYVSNPKNE